VTTLKDVALHIERGAIPYADGWGIPQSIYDELAAALAAVPKTADEWERWIDKMHIAWTDAPKKTIREVGTFRKFLAQSLAASGAEVPGVGAGNIKAMRKVFQYARMWSATMMNSRFAQDQEDGKQLMNILPTLEYVTLDQPRPSPKCRWTWYPTMDGGYWLPQCGHSCPNRFSKFQREQFDHCPGCHLLIVAYRAGSGKIAGPAIDAIRDTDGAIAALEAALAAVPKTADELAKLIRITMHKYGADATQAWPDHLAQALAESGAEVPGQAEARTLLKQWLDPATMKARRRAFNMAACRIEQFGAADALEYCKRMRNQYTQDLEEHSEHGGPNAGGDRTTASAKTEDRHSDRSPGIAGGETPDLPAENKDIEDRQAETPEG